MSWTYITRLRPIINCLPKNWWNLFDYLFPFQLHKIQAWVEMDTQHTFNHCLINWDQEKKILRQQEWQDYNDNTTVPDNIIIKLLLFTYCSLIIGNEKPALNYSPKLCLRSEVCLYLCGRIDFLFWSVRNRTPYLV